MKSNLQWFVYCALAVLLVFPESAQAQNQDTEIILPAGTLLRCTLDEPNFSSKTADIGDPVVCPLGGLMMFDRTVFPRGAYLGGHLEAAKDPGHFFGKGYLKLEFDHIGLPDEEIPVPAKVIAASSYRVDKQGRIIGHGHATRDAAEWMVPPLWPLKVLTLPDRGPRPALKGEEQLSLRLMDDVAVPMSGWHSFGAPSSRDVPRHSELMPGGYGYGSMTPRVPPTVNQAQSATVQNPAGADPASLTASSASANLAPHSVLVLRNGATYITTTLHADGNRLSYTLAHGGSGEVSLDEVDWAKTFRSNSEKGATLALDSGNSGR